MIFPDTIAAIATALGEGALAVVRLSGRDAVAVADRCFQPAGARSARAADAASHTVQYGHIVRNGRVMDEVLLSVLRAPRTYTREDVVEISGHGGMLAARLILHTLLECGARLAEPGEFTKRAFLNGRLDLAQAEAVADLIHSRTELALAVAHEQLAGRLSQLINRLRDNLMIALAHLEAHIDFPEEDIAPDTAAALEDRLEAAARDLDHLLRTADEGRVLRRGIRAAIIGRPNVGKSTLLNLLLGHDRAIVSPTPGTTRDTIEETANIRGVPVVFIDTAGLRESEDALEQEGMRRSRRAFEQAELVLHVLDNAEPWTDLDRSHLDAGTAKKRILIRNKTDLPTRLQLPSDLPGPLVDVSCLSGAGLEALKDAIQALVWAGVMGAETLHVAINSRHQDALRRAQEALARARAALGQGLSLEFVALDLRIGVNAVGEVVGKTTTEDLLDAVFSQFCLGK